MKTTNLLYNSRRALERKAHKKGGSLSIRSSLRLPCTFLVRIIKDIQHTKYNPRLEAALIGSSFPNPSLAPSVAVPAPKFRPPQVGALCELDMNSKLFTTKFNTLLWSIRFDKSVLSYLDVSAFHN